MVFIPSSLSIHNKQTHSINQMPKRSYFILHIFILYYINSMPLYNSHRICPVAKTKDVYRWLDVAIYDSIYIKLSLSRIIIHLYNFICTFMNTWPSS